MDQNPIRPLLRRPQAAIMGIINTTPDSFSDGGSFLKKESAIKHALTLIEEGVDILDVGGESTRPGAAKVSLQEELDRVIPVIETLSRETDTAISIDTYKPEVMLAAAAAGASMINDVNGLRVDGAMDAAAQAQLPVCIMHMQGDPETMQNAPNYQSVRHEVSAFLKQRIDSCIAAGIEADDIIIDPGIGFGKTLEHNLQLLNTVDLLKAELGCEMLIGVSRKSLIDKLFGRAMGERLPASLALAVQSVIKGAKIVRVHDVRATYDAIRVIEAVQNS